ncbi:hypothetical protein [Proteus mirabilis]|uniref:hypothetical protein n=1 Tax=Proteus mirabilis TaxID=584 RepID=UPI00300DEDDC
MTDDEAGKSCRKHGEVFIRPPDELHKNRLIFGALVKSGETRQDYRDIRSFPLTAPSCALLFPPYKFTAGFNPLFPSLGALSLSFPVPALQLLPTTIFSLKRLSDNEGKDGNPTDIELIFIENGLPKTKNISLKNNHNAVKHQRPGSLISQLGISDKNEDNLYRECIKSLERTFISSVESLGFNTSNELLFSDIKSCSEQVILDLYNSFCSLTASVINKFGSIHAGDYFHFLVSRTDFEKLIVYPNKIIIQEWYQMMKMHQQRPHSFLIIAT